MINHNAIFRDELKKIASAINKKHVVLRKEVIKTTEVFQNNQLPVFPYQVCFGLFRNIVEASSVTSSLIFFPFLQNIINLGFANEEMSRQIINLLTHIKSIPKFHSHQNSSKLQTILMLLVGKHAVNLHNLNYTHSIINILFSLQNTRSKNLWMKTISTLNQIVLLFVNELKQSFSEQKLKIFNQFLSDMVRIAKKQSPKWLVEIPLEYISLALISDLLDEKYFREHFEYHKYVFENLIQSLKKPIQKIAIPLITSNHSLKQGPQKGQKNHWELTPQNQLITLMRVCCKLSKLSLQIFQILEQTIKIISEKGSSSVKYIGYESINFLFNSTNWMEAMLTSPSGDLFNFLMTTLFNNAKFILSQYKDKTDLTIEYQLQKSVKLFHGNYVDFISFDFLPVIELRMIIKNIEQITFTLYSIYNQIYKISMETSLQTQKIIPLEKTYKFCQKTVFEISKALIPKDMPEDVLQSLLKICQKFINLSGVFNDHITATTYMKLICKYCLPAEFKNIGHRHVQINKMILNTANCLGNLFSTGCWAIVWKALQNYTIYYNRYLLGKEELQAERRSDVQILYKSMDSIFTESKKYENEYLLKIIRSLIQVTYECLQNNFSEESKKIFAFQRIEQIYKLNLHRLPIIWPQLSSSLLCITTSKVSYFRLSALNLLNILVPISLHYTKTHPQILTQKMTKQNHEVQILEPWVNLAGCQFQQIRSQLAVAVNKIIIDYGHIMERGWSSILQIVKKTKDIKSLQAIVQTYLDKINDSIMQTINIIDQVERSLQDINQKYLCLTLIWAIGDHCHKNQQNQALRKIYQILLQPEEMFVIGMEARHSSFYIFAEIIVHNCSQKEEGFWKWIFSQISNYYNFAMKKCIQRKENSSCQDQLKNILLNLIKIYRRLFLVSKQFKTNELVLNQLDKFYRLSSQMLRFRQSEVYQMVLKQIKEILNLKTYESLTRNQFWKLLQTLNQIYFVQNDNKILKCLITYLPNEIYQIILKTLPELQNKLGTIYHLAQKVFLLRLEAEQKDIKLNQLRIFFQEKTYLQFFKKIHNEIHKIEDPNEQQIGFLNVYLDNLLKTTHKLLLYEDYYYLQKYIWFVSSTIFKYAQKIDLKASLDLLKLIINLKYDQNWIKNYSNSKEIPIWYFATQQLIKQGYQYNVLKLQEPYQRVFQILSDSINEKQKFEQNQKLSLYSEQSLVLFYENYLQVLNFLAECYFLNENFEINEEDIERICEIIKRQAAYNEKDKTNKSKNSYELLFKLAAKRIEEGIYNQKIINRQGIFIKHLFQRVLRSFDEYFSVVQLPKQKITSPGSQKEAQNEFSDKSHDKKQAYNKQQFEAEIKFILKKFLHFQLKENILQSKNLRDFLGKNYVQNVNIESQVLKCQISHLYYFNGCIAKCIKSNNYEMREVISEIYLKMGNELIKS